MSVNLVSLLEKAVKAIPAKSTLRTEIAEALEARQLGTERANKAWETRRAAMKPARVVKSPRTAKPKVKAKA